MAEKQQQADLDIEDRIERAESILGIKFRSRNLLRQALTHPSATVGEENYNRLSFVGNQSVLLATSEHLYRSTEDPESKLHGMPLRVICEIRNAIVSRENLKDVAKGLGMREVVLLGKGMERSRATLGINVMPDVLQAVVGGIHIDQGSPAAQQKAHQWVLGDFDQKLETYADSPVVARVLIERVIQAARQKYGHGHFEALEIDQAERIMKNQGILMGVYYNGKLLGIGKGHSKDMAKQRASINAYLHQKDWTE